VTYKELSYDDKFSKSITLLIVAGVFGIILGKVILVKDHNFKNGIIDKGLCYGGWILIGTALLANWNTSTDGLKLIVTGGILMGLIWFSYKNWNVDDIELIKRPQPVKINKRSKKASDNLNKKTKTGYDFKEDNFIY
jgi:hypothetical protein